MHGKTCFVCFSLIFMSSILSKLQILEKLINIYPHIQKDTLQNYLLFFAVVLIKLPVSSLQEFSSLMKNHLKSRLP